MALFPDAAEHGQYASPHPRPLFLQRCRRRRVRGTGAGRRLLRAQRRRRASALAQRGAAAVSGGGVSPGISTYAIALSAGDGHEYWRTALTSERLTLVCSAP